MMMMKNEENICNLTTPRHSRYWLEVLNSFERRRQPTAYGSTGSTEAKPLTNKRVLASLIKVKGSTVVGSRFSLFINCLWWLRRFHRGFAARKLIVGLVVDWQYYGLVWCFGWILEHVLHHNIKVKRHNVPNHLGSFFYFSFQNLNSKIWLRKICDIPFDWL